MKMLTTFVLVCAGMALTNAAAVPEPEQMTGKEGEEASVHGGELLLNHTVPEAEPHEEMTGEAHHQQDDGVVFSADCPGGWSRFNNRCFLFIGTAQTWAIAERNCRAQGGNLASIHSFSEETFVKGVIQRGAHGSPRTWIGGSDAQQDGIWLWSDSSHFAFTNWNQGEPNGGGHEHCTEMNFGDGRCWNDLSCSHYRPYVCVRRV